MKWLIYALLALAGSVLVGLVALPDPGYVLLGYGKYSVETTLLTLMCSLLAAYFVLRFLLSVFRVPQRLQAWNMQQKRVRDRKRLDHGLIELVEGNPHTAEQTLRHLTENSDNPLITYLAAARAAQQQGAIERRDQYLDLAQTRLPKARLAIDLSRAELQMAQGQYATALTTLDSLRKLYPDHAQIIKYLQNIYQQSGDWPRLKQLLPDIKRRKVATPEVLQTITLKVHQELLLAAAKERDLPGLQQLWQEMPRQIRQESELVSVYAGHLLDLHADDAAEILIRDATARTWDKQLAYLYGNLRDGDAVKQLETVESWLKQHPEDSRLLLSAARLSMRNELWGKAKSYVEASIGQEATPESYQLLGLLCEKNDDAPLAMAAYRHGLNMLADQSGKPVALPAIAISDDSKQETTNTESASK
jgi:HemY protein